VLDRLRTLPAGTDPAVKLELLRSPELSGLVREVYFEGPVEVLSENELVARSDAIYLDLTPGSQHGWLAGATVNFGGQFLGQRHEKISVKAKWLRLESDGSLRANLATVTSCTFEEPTSPSSRATCASRPCSSPARSTTSSGSATTASSCTGGCASRCRRSSSPPTRS
jgi:hypothetical protein